MCGTGWVVVLGKLDRGESRADAGKTSQMETRQMGTWSEDGEKGRGRVLERMRTELRWVRRTGRLVTGGGKAGALDGLGVVGRVYCGRARGQ